MTDSKTATERLRELLKGCGCSDKCYSCGINFHGSIADEIEAEIESRYMLLPVDADGVPIRIGDYLYSDETKRNFPCRGYNLTLQTNNKWWTVECCYDSYSGTSEYVSAKSCHHVNPRTIEDVLREFAEKCAEGSLVYAEADVRKYADELRELMEVD